MISEEDRRAWESFSDARDRFIVLLVAAGAGFTLAVVADIIIEALS